MILNKAKEVAGTAVVVRWEPPLEGACPVMSYNVYYREVISQAVKSKWNTVTVSRNATIHTLQLNCRKEYEIAVTSLNTHGESDLKDSRTWRFKTLGGNKVLFAAYTLGSGKSAFVRHFQTNSSDGKHRQYISGKPVTRFVIR